MSKLNYFEVKLNIVIIHSSLHCHQCIFHNGIYFFILLDRRCFAVLLSCVRSRNVLDWCKSLDTGKKSQSDTCPSRDCFPPQKILTSYFSKWQFFCPEGTATWKKVRFCFIQDKVYSECYVCSLTSLGNLLKNYWFNRNRRTFPSLLKYPWYSSCWKVRQRLQSFKVLSNGFQISVRPFTLWIENSLKACR